MKKLILLSTALFTVSCVLATAAAATDSRDAIQRPAYGFLVKRIERRLAVTDAQRAQIRQILAAERPVIQSLAARVQQEQDELRSSERAGFNEQMVREFAAAHQQTAVNVLVEREKVRSEIMQVLTTEQQQKLETMRMQWGGQFVDRLSTLGDQL